ncbi:TolC family protein [Myroides odoratimimus]|uniref:TolC family protein n=1 Tax=Myroides odoratimimus TaxID=76832 RepID=UPI0025752578|nr:TolC family protein [Myroides odoratimimus]
MKRLDLRDYFSVVGGILFFIGMSSSVYAQESLSFTDAYNKMYQDNSLIKAVEKQEEVHHYKWQATKGLRYPSVRAFGGGLYLSKSLGVDLNGLKNGIGDFIHLPNPDVLGNWSKSFNKKDMVFGGLMATWPLYTGGKINAAIKAHEIESKIGEKDLEKTKNKLITELAQRYYSVKLAEEAVAVRRTVLEGMNKHLHDATKLEEHGMIAAVEKMSADVAVSEANRQLDGALKDAKLARLALANTLEVDEVTATLDSDFFSIPQLENVDFFQGSAVENYPELQKLVLQKELADQGVKVKQSANYPTVFGFGQTILAHNNPILIGEKDSKPWVVGIGVSYTLFEGFKNKNEIKAAKATRESVELFETKAKSDVKMLVAKLYQDIQKQEDQIKSLNVQEKLAEEYLRVRSKAFSEGFATSTEVVDAEMNLSGVRLMKLQANYNYAIGVASLFEVAGLSHDFLQYTK